MQIFNWLCLYLMDLSDIAWQLLHQTKATPLQRHRTPLLMRVLCITGVSCS